MSKTKILVVDDQYNICELIRLYLEKEGFEALIALNGTEALNIFKQQTPSLVILDIMLPGMDGWSVCKEIRKTGSTPIIMLTAKGETIDKVQGLDLGADDYMVKPFEMKELMARIKAVLRRYNKTDDKEQELTFPNLSINVTTRQLKVNGNDVELARKELELLYLLASNPNKVFTRDQLLNEIWGYEYYGDSRTVDVHIKRLREKLEQRTVTPEQQKWQLKTVWGVGYKFEVI